MKGLKMKDKASKSNIQTLRDEFVVFEKAYIIPITHLKSKAIIDTLAKLKNHPSGKNLAFTQSVQPNEYRNTDEFSVTNNLWYLKNKPVFYKKKHATIFDIPNLPEFCSYSIYSLYRDLDKNGRKYYYVDKNSYKRYLDERTKNEN